MVRSRQWIRKLQIVWVFTLIVTVGCQNELEPIREEELPVTPLSTKESDKSRTVPQSMGEQEVINKDLYYRVVDWEFDDKEEYIYAAAYATVDYDENVLLKINAETLEVEHTAILKPNIRAVDLEYGNNKVFIATKDNLMVYDTKTNMVPDKVGENFFYTHVNQITDIEFAGDRLYFMNRAYDNGHIYHQLRYLDLTTKEIEIVAADENKGRSYYTKFTQFLLPEIEVDEKGRRLFLGEMGAGRNPRVLTVSMDTLEILDSASFPPYEGYIAPIVLHYNGGDLVYDKYVLNSQKLSEVLGQFPDFERGNELRYANDKYVVSLDAIFRRHPLKRMDEHHFEPPYLIKEDTIIYNSYGYMGQTTKLEKQKIASDVFTDLSNYEAEITFLHEKGIINGFPDGSFKPLQPLSRLQAVTMILRALDIDPTKDVKNPGFTDLKPGENGYEAIAKAVELGIVTGKPDGRFDRYGQLTRGQMAKILVNAFSLSGTTTIDFKDVKGHWSKTYVDKLAGAQITKGYPGSLYKPNEQISRQHFSLFMYRVLKE
ncbi:S-layer homology domain-containing protein [Bacillus salitolerans]|uniref:S-layer homology domain-containing protein n=1 Tax=Bacillus salitolerans TaxID=1437434 RepID=A0ABW4LZ82_9BACI